jgi:hypothetical protein
VSLFLGSKLKSFGHHLWINDIWSPFRYHNYHLFSFVPIQERLSGRVLDTAYMGAAGVWIPVMQPFATSIMLSCYKPLVVCRHVSQGLQIPNPQALAHAASGSEVRIPVRRSS